MIDPQEYRLTQYSHGAGCGCKISPQVLDKILASSQSVPDFPNLLVGNQERDDAAVMDLGDGTAIISTTDFFMPIVDNAFDFGRIAAVNAISDVYAMGGTPLVAIAILGWPINEIPAEVARDVINGGRQACTDAGIPLAGGHSIDSPEPIFGLAVTGRVPIEQLKKNGGAQIGDQLFLTKPLGVGILSTAQKKGKLRTQDETLARDSMIKLNKIGEELAKLPYVHAMTDVTGFGLLGHLREMMEASTSSAQLDFTKIPLLDSEAIHHYLMEGCVPGGTNRNWASYGDKIGPLTDRQRHILCDPQTSGGLLVAVAPEELTAFKQFAVQVDHPLYHLGSVTAQGDKLVIVQ
ncbi:MAG: selenide, water dikinase SelD [Bacteroidota bacterium]